MFYTFVSFNEVNLVIAFTSCIKTFNKLLLQIWPFKIPFKVKLEIVNYILPKTIECIIRSFSTRRTYSCTTSGNTLSTHPSKCTVVSIGPFWETIQSSTCKSNLPLPTCSLDFERRPCNTRMGKRSHGRCQRWGIVRRSSQFTELKSRSPTCSATC